MIMVKKKSYNPFVMWGSYVGAVVLLVLVYLFNTIKGGVYCPSLNHAIVEGTGRVICAGDVTTTFLFGLSFMNHLLIIIAIGFLVGWGIHSLVRAARN